MDTLTEKAHRRVAARREVGAVPPEARAAQARSVTGRIEASAVWQGARRVLLFVPLPDEVDVRPLLDSALAAGKQVALPSFDGESGTYVAREVRDAARDLAPGRFGILEPGGWCRTVPLADLEVLLVPGLAFDRHGGRLGRGKGFYDRLLSMASGRKWGVAFEEQLGPPVPREPHDQRLDGVFTASGFHPATTQD